MKRSGSSLMSFWSSAYKRKKIDASLGVKAKANNIKVYLRNLKEDIKGDLLKDTWEARLKGNINLVLLRATWEVHRQVTISRVHLRAFKERRRTRKGSIRIGRHRATKEVHRKASLATSGSFREK
jgi:hypothetical protein